VVTRWNRFPLGRLKAGGRRSLIFWRRRHEFVAQPWCQKVIQQGIRVNRLERGRGGCGNRNIAPCMDLRIEMFDAANQVMKQAAYGLSETASSRDRGLRRLVANPGMFMRLFGDSWTCTPDRGRSLWTDAAELFPIRSRDYPERGRKQPRVRILFLCGRQLVGCTGCFKHRHLGENARAVGNWRLRRLIFTAAPAAHPAGYFVRRSMFALAQPMAAGRDRTLLSEFLCRGGTGCAVFAVAEVARNPVLAAIRTTYCDNRLLLGG